MVSRIKDKISLQDLKHALGVVLGALIVSLSINSLIISNEIADGGLTGIAIITHYLFNWPVSWIILILNIPLFLLGWRMVGRKFLILSIIGVLSLSFFLSISTGIRSLTDDIFLASVFGGVITGIGMGIVFRSHGSLGGTDILAVLISRFTAFSVGQILMGIDAVIFLVTAILFTPEKAMYAMIYMFIAAKVIDLVQEGMGHSKSVMVISSKYKEIAEAIMTKLDRGVTFLQAQGAYSGENKQVIYCIVSRTELSQVKQIVYEHDQKAFMAISEVPEVVGEGFSKWRGH